MYIPKKTVERLIRHGEVTETISDAREVTVMFTDMVGFSVVSENMFALGAEFNAVTAGHRKLEGRSGEIEVFKLLSRST